MLSQQVVGTQFARSTFAMTEDKFFLKRCNYHLARNRKPGSWLQSQTMTPSPCGHAGVLVLSEFAGAAQSLGAGAILVNPWNITDMAAAIQDALTMSEQVLKLS